MLSTITNRRSIRKYKDQPVSDEIIETIISAGTLAPSSKNRQPWKFVVVTEDSKQDMLLAMKKGLQREKEQPLLPESSQFLGGAEYTLSIMEQAPTVIFIINPLGRNIRSTLNPEERISEICNIQSIGACIENMSLAATEMGLGSLWICDVFFAYDELSVWLNAEGELIAAMTIGYADESPEARPRKDLKHIIEWRTTK